MFWVQFARSDLRAGASHGSPELVLREAYQVQLKAAREGSSEKQVDAKGPYLTTTILGNCFPGSPAPWHAAQRCTTDAGLWGREKHLQQQRQHQFSGPECQSGQLCERAGRVCRSTALLNAGNQDFLGTFFSFTENKWPDLKGALVCVPVLRRT